MVSQYIPTKDLIKWSCMNLHFKCVFSQPYKSGNTFGNLSCMIESFLHYMYMSAFQRIHILIHHHRPIINYKQNMIEIELIQSSNTDFNAPVILVDKTDSYCASISENWMLKLNSIQKRSHTSKLVRRTIECRLQFTCGTSREKKVEQADFALNSGNWKFEPNSTQHDYKQNMIEVGLVEPSNLDFNSLVVLVEKKMEKQILHWFQEIECFNQIRPIIDYKQNMIEKYNRVSRTIEFRFQFTCGTSREKRWYKHQIMRWFQKIECFNQIRPIINYKQNMIEIGLIQPPNTNFNAPVILVEKTDGTIRLCIDFGKLNG